MANIPPIQFKRSHTPGAIPTASQLAVGELAINMSDNKLYTKDSDGVIRNVGGSSGDTYAFEDFVLASTVNPVLTITNTDLLALTSATDFYVMYQGYIMPSAAYTVGGTVGSWTITLIGDSDYAGTTYSIGDLIRVGEGMPVTATTNTFSSPITTQAELNSLGVENYAVIAQANENISGVLYSTTIAQNTNTMNTSGTATTATGTVTLNGVSTAIVITCTQAVNTGYDLSEIFLDGSAAAATQGYLSVVDANNTLTFTFGNNVLLNGMSWTGTRSRYSAAVTVNFYSDAARTSLLKSVVTNAATASTTVQTALLGATYSVRSISLVIRSIDVNLGSGMSNLKFGAPASQLYPSGIYYKKSFVGNNSLDLLPIVTQ